MAKLPTDADILPPSDDHIFKTLLTHPSKGKKYDELVRTYQITFCSYTVLPERPHFVNRAALRFEDGKLFSDQINIVVIEMSKLGDALKKNVKELTSL